MTSSTTPPDPRRATGDEPPARKPASSGATDDRSVTVDGAGDGDPAGEAPTPGAYVDEGGALDENAIGAD
jgi:hypothetical protein